MALLHPPLLENLAHTIREEAIAGRCHYFFSSGEDEARPPWAIVFEPEPFRVEGESDDIADYDDLEVQFHRILALLTNVTEFEFNAHEVALRGNHEGIDVAVLINWMPDFGRPPRLLRLADGTFKSTETVH